jgi:peptidyl-dipeptidase Dcp
MRHRIPQFGHIFSSDGYAAGYYSYLWADVISTDAYEALPKETDLMTKKSRRGFTKAFLAWEIHRSRRCLQKFWGRDPKSDALMSKRF